MIKYKHYNIFGLSEATISHIFETLSNLNENKIQATIVHNVPYNPKLPFAHKNIIHTIISDSKLDYKGIKNCFLGVHRPHVKKQVYNYFENEHEVNPSSYINIVSKHSIVSSTTKMKFGNYICDGTIFSSYVNLASFITISKGCIIGHHTNIGDFCTLNQAVQIAGNCEIGENVSIGMAAKIVDGITIGKNTIIGAGSLVNKNIPEGVVAYGVPAKIIRTSETKL